jgi:DMSO/TMAO reductase YedYZ molybdopterin-dependent catalytic subunit
VAPPPEAAVEPDEPAPTPPAARRLRGWLDALAEPAEAAIEIPRRRLASQTRRDFMMWGAGVAATLAGAWWLLPDRARSRLAAGDPWLDTLAARVGLARARRERWLDRALTFDDDVAEALYSKDRRVRTYSRSDVTALRNNYHGRTPGPEVLPGWTLEISGLAAGNLERLTLEDLARRFAMREQVTRLVCVEGWSAVAWWGGIRFADLLQTFPPAAGARWAALRSEVSLDSSGRREPYYVSIDLGTARHPQTLLATHHAGAPLTLAHGAPLRLIAPMKLGLKNIKAITHIAYGAQEPADYWNELGYSRYDGL